MPPTTKLVVETRARGLWRVRLLRPAVRLMSRRLALAAGRWAVRRVTVDVRTPGRPWRRHGAGFDIKVPDVPPTA